MCKLSCFVIPCTSFISNMYVFMMAQSRQDLKLWREAEQKNAIMRGLAKADSQVGINKSCCSSINFHSRVELQQSNYAPCLFPHLLLSKKPNICILLAQDLVIVSDLDEIPRAMVIAQLKRCQGEGRKLEIPSHCLFVVSFSQDRHIATPLNTHQFNSLFPLFYSQAIRCPSSCTCRPLHTTLAAR